MCYKEANNSSTTISSSSIEKTLVGQERGIFEPYEYLGEDIRKKYSYVVPGSFYQQMQWWKGICVDVNPYAMVNIRYNGDETYNTYTVGGTGVLHMLENTEVIDMCFIGRRMNIVDSSEQAFLREWECVLDDSVNTGEITTHTWKLVDGEIDTGRQVFIQQDDGAEQYDIDSEWNPITEYSIPAEVNDIKNPRYNTVYQVAGSLYIYYINGQWYPIGYMEKYEDTMLAAVPIEGLISYYGDVIRNTYA